MPAGRIAEAVPLRTQALGQTRAQDNMIYQAFGRLPLGEAQMLAGCLEEACALAERALAHADAPQERGHQAYSLCLLGDIVMRHEERKPGEAHYRQARALAEELDMLPLAAHCHRGLGTLYATTCRREQARTEPSAAMDLYRSLDMTFWLPEAEAALAQVEGR